MTTRDKLTFVHSMARSTRATVRQCEALLRYASTLRTLAESDAAKPDFTGSTYRLERTQARIRRKVTELCEEIATQPAREVNKAMERPCVPVFADPVLKIRTSGGEEIEVPS